MQKIYYSRCELFIVKSLLGVRGVFFDEIIIFTKADAILSPYNPLECLLFYLSRCSVRNGIARD